MSASPNPSHSSLYSEIAKTRATEQIRALLEGAGVRSVNYDVLCDWLRALAFPEVAIPTKEEFQALTSGGQAEKPKEERVPFPLALSDETRRLWAAGLRALAKDLERGVPAALSEEALDAARARLLGTPVRGGLVFKDGRHVYVPSRGL